MDDQIPIPFSQQGGKTTERRATRLLNETERTGLIAMSAGNRREAQKQRELEASLATQRAIEILAAASTATSQDGPDTYNEAALRYPNTARCTRTISRP
jgi:hypothetical protein